MWILNEVATQCSAFLDITWFGDQSNPLVLNNIRKHPADFVVGCRERGCTPYVSQNNTKRHSAIDARSTRHPGYRISSIERKRIEEPFGWIKTVGGLRRTCHRGAGLLEWFFVLTPGAYNLVRIPKFLAATTGWLCLECQQ